MLTSLGLCVWYFPLWYMGISGYEALIMCTLTPFLLGAGPLRKLVVKNIRLVQIMSLAGLIAYQVKDPKNRLFTVSFGVGMSVLALSAQFFSAAFQPIQLESKIVGFAGGLVMHSVVKFAWQTSNPIWPTVHAENGGYNAIGGVLALLAVLRSSRVAPSVIENPAERKKAGSSILAAFGLAGLFFGMHSLLSDSSTMILWVWEGFPVRGPIAAPHGALTIAAMSGGLILGLISPGLARSWTAYGIGCVGAAFLTLHSHWTGYYGALTVTAYLMAFAVPMIQAAAKRSPATTFGLGFFLYNFLVLFHVWVVAYAFVPGGPYVREHTDWIMITTMAFIGMGVFSILSSEGKADRKFKKPAYVTPRKQRSYFLWILAGLQTLAVAIAYLRFPTYDYTPYHKDEKLITAGIWTVHFSLDNDMWSSEYRMRDLIQEMELDVIGMLETDTQRIIMGNRDTSQFLAEELGMYVDYGPGPNKHTWGCVLLSKFPILNSTHHLLPSPVGELAPAIHATLDVYGDLVDVFVFHSGQEEDPEDRRLQSEYLADLMGSTNRPAILLSYLVTRPHEGNYHTYVGDRSGMKDIDPSPDFPETGQYDRWCEYILYKNLRRTGYARVSRSTITDTELQVGKFIVGPAPADEQQRIEENQVPEGLRFPQKFRGEGVRGHRYHVFDEPRYFAS
jgi:endonuclease/exonuclease/phosphatase family metal-dependent hydrolase